MKLPEPEPAPASARPAPELDPVLREPDTAKVTASISAVEPATTLTLLGVLTVSSSIPAVMSATTSFWAAEAPAAIAPWEFEPPSDRAMAAVPASASMAEESVAVTETLPVVVSDPPKSSARVAEVMKLPDPAPAPPNAVLVLLAPAVPCSVRAVMSGALVAVMVTSPAAMVAAATCASVSVVTMLTATEAPAAMASALPPDVMAMAAPPASPVREESSVAVTVSAPPASTVPPAPMAACARLLTMLTATLPLPAKVKLLSLLLLPVVPLPDPPPLLLPVVSEPATPMATASRSALTSASSVTGPRARSVVLSPASARTSFSTSKAAAAAPKVEPPAIARPPATAVPLVSSAARIRIACPASAPAFGVAFTTEPSPRMAWVEPCR